MSLKRLVQENVVNPAAWARGEIYHKIAEVTKTDESNNVCSIKYVDKDAFVSNKDNVPLRIYSPTMQDWFPEVGDIVAIEEVDGQPVITGVPEDSYNVNVKSKNELQEDITSDVMSCDSEGGYIL
jgi:hypothetical protein